MLYQNFQCDGSNDWRATNGIKSFIIVNNQVFEAWVAGALFTKKQGTKTVVVIPQDPVLCRKGRSREGCLVELHWDALRSKFISLNGPMILTPYKRAFQ